uniref:Uncharacterized protein n=1 Tax=Anguilla anguilla TaxID=7936 RepID=A0A0E9V7Q4_ANGAN
MVGKLQTTEKRLKICSG